jgi:hypothetical protein
LPKKLLPPGGDYFWKDDNLARALSLSSDVKAGKHLTVNVSIESILHVPVSKSYDGVLKENGCEISAEYKITRVVGGTAAQPASYRKSEYTRCNKSSDDDDDDDDDDAEEEKEQKKASSAAVGTKRKAVLASSAATPASSSGGTCTGSSISNKKGKKRMNQDSGNDGNGYDGKIGSEGNSIPL